ncbi:membrane protein [Pseudomonas aeruginosa]|nr:membrane protein [Pseudomonas aeruginosa]
MTSDRLAGYSRLMATLTLLLIAACCCSTPRAGSSPTSPASTASGFALTATGVAGDLGVVARDMPLWQALGGILLSSLPLLVLASGLQALRRLFQHYGRGEYFCEDAAALLGKVGLCLACWVLANFLLEPLLTVWVTFLQPQGQRIVSLSFGSAELVSLFAAASVMVITRIQRKAALLAEENRPVRLRSAMPIEIRLDVMLALRKARSKDLAQAIGIHRTTTCRCSSRAR